MSHTTRPLIYLEEYDEQWPAWFKAEAAQISQALDVPLRDVHHIGSTAVVGLSSKPIIDLLVTVPALATVDDYLDRLRPLGYSFRDVKDAGRIFYEKRGEPKYHVHVVESDSWHYWRLVLFRDRLRRDPGTATVYVNLKRRLALAHPDDRDSYSGGKTDFVTRCVRDELAQLPEVKERLRAKGAPVDTRHDHKRDPDSESFSFRG